MEARVTQLGRRGMMRAATGVTSLGFRMARRPTRL